MEACNKGGIDVKRRLYPKQIEVLSQAKLGSVTPDQFTGLRDTFSALEQMGLISPDRDAWVITPTGMESVESGFFEYRKNKPPGRKKSGLKEAEFLSNQHRYNLRLNADLDSQLENYCKEHKVTRSDFIRTASLKLIDDKNHKDSFDIVEPQKRIGAITIQTPILFPNDFANTIISYCESRGYRRSVFFRVAIDRALAAEDLEPNFQNMLAILRPKVLSEISDGSLLHADKDAEQIKRYIAKIELSANNGVVDRDSLKKCTDLKIKDKHPSLKARLERALEHAASVKNLMMIERLVAKIENDALNGKIDSDKTHKCRARGIQHHKELFKRMESAMNQARANRNKGKNKVK